MPWANGPIALYHGTDDISATAIRRAAFPHRHGINLALSAPLTDFGPGFYVTTHLRQASNWANLRYVRTQSATKPAARAVVLQFDVDRNQLAGLDTLWFVIEGAVTSDFWEVITFCRAGKSPVRSGHVRSNYDVILGPVSLWPQTLVIKDCDQASFNTKRALGALPRPSIAVRGNPTIP